MNGGMCTVVADMYRYNKYIHTQPAEDQKQEI